MVFGIRKNGFRKPHTLNPITLLAAHYNKVINSLKEMDFIKRNIFRDIPHDLPEELVEIIAERNTTKIVRIVSKGQNSPADFWYDQAKNEFVMLLRGKAGLVFEGENNVITMEPGDYINIPAHAKHRVEWTDLIENTVWLAVYYWQYVLQKR